MVKIISIEGNIGSGKSTFVKELKENIKDVLFLDEPVDTWNNVKDENGKTIIEKYYEEPKKYAFSFQMMAYISRLSLIKKAIESEKYDVIITERCLHTDKNVFTQMLYDEGMINSIEYNIYNKWFDEFIETNNIYYIYLKTTPIIASKRVIKRNRKGENIELSYLKKCNDYHDKWLSTVNDVLILNANNEKNKKETDEWIDKVKQIIYS